MWSALGSTYEAIHLNDIKSLSTTTTTLTAPDNMVMQDTTMPVADVSLIAEFGQSTISSTSSMLQLPKQSQANLQPTAHESEQAVPQFLSESIRCYARGTFESCQKRGSGVMGTIDRR
jgi:hypothetical protein